MNSLNGRWLLGVIHLCFLFISFKIASKSKNQTGNKVNPLSFFQNWRKRAVPTFTSNCHPFSFGIFPQSPARNHKTTSQFSCPAAAAPTTWASTPLAVAFAPSVAIRVTDDEALSNCEIFKRKSASWFEPTHTDTHLDFIGPGVTSLYRKISHLQQMFAGKL